MRVLHVTNDMEIGGVQQYLSRLLPALADRGHQLALAVVTGEGRLLPAPPVIWRYCPAIGRGAGLKWPRPGAVRKLSRFIAEFSPDIVHTHLLAGNTVGRLAALSVRPRPRIVATEHSTYFDKPRWARAADRWLARRSDRMMAVSQTVAKFTAQQERIPAEKFITVRLGLPPDANAAPPPGDSPFPIPSGRPVVGIVGRLHPDKGHSWFLEVLAQLIRENPDVLGVVAGDGPSRAQLERQAHTLGLGEANLRFLGFVANIRQITKRFNVFLLPSKREGFGLAPLEAMALEVPVVLSRIPAFEELTNGGKYGTLVPLYPEGSLRDWVDAVQAALDHPPDTARIGKAIERQFSWDGHVRQLEALYQSLVR